MPLACPASRIASRGVSLTGALALGAALVAPPHVRAQRVETASLGGIVLEADTGRPLVGAAIHVSGLAHGTTGADGRFILYDLPAGTHRIVIAYRGRDAPERSLELAAGRHTDVRIVLTLSAGPPPDDRDPIPLPPLDIRVDRPDLPGKLRPFYHRLEAGRGAFITREDIEARDPRQISDMLREVAGIRVSGSWPNPGISTVRGCGLGVWIDGLPAPGFRVDDMPPADVAGVEIYTGPSVTPVQFRRVGGCGALVIWTTDPNDPI